VGRGDPAAGGGADVEVRVAALEAALADRDAALADRDAALADREAKLAAQEARIDELTAQLRVLTEKLNQNSKNSHLPPSSDGPGSAGSGGPKNAEPKSKSKRKRGGQKGHRGAHRELLPPESVSTFVDFFPDHCGGCAREDLPHVLDPEARRYQQLDIRDHRPHLTEFRRHELECPDCGARTRAAYDPAQIPSSAFGPCLTAIVGLLTGVYHLSRRKTQQLLHELFDISVSLGAVSTMEKRASEALGPAYEEAVQEVERAGVKHADATSWLRSGVLMSLWTIATVSATVYGIFADGAQKTIRPFFGSRRGILISDRATVFNFWVMCMRQICWAHLFRKFISFSERDGPAGAIGRDLLEYTSLVFEYWHGYKEGVLTRDEFEMWLQPVRRAFELTLERAAKADISRLSGSCADILAHREALWTFVTEDGVEPTNNHAERELRAFVLWRKLSFGTQSERGERFAERLMTVAHTARKQRKAVRDFIVKSVQAHVDGTTAPRLIDTPAGG
jgi:transposase